MSKNQNEKIQNDPQKTPKRGHFSFGRLVTILVWETNLEFQKNTSNSLSKTMNRVGCLYKAVGVRENRFPLSNGFGF